MKRTKAQIEAAIDAILERPIPEWNGPVTGSHTPCEPCRNESGEVIFVCHFAGDGTPCQTCGADQVGGAGCISLS